VLNPSTTRGIRGPLKIVDVDPRAGFPSLSGLHRYAGVIALVWLADTPVGYVEVPVKGEACWSSDIRTAVLDNLQESLIRAALVQADEDAAVIAKDSDCPSITVAVCTRGRASHLHRCLAALERLDYPSLEIVIVDSGPTEDAVRRLVSDRFPRFRYVSESQPGLSRARNAAIRHARGQIIAFTDDDCVPDPRWTRAIGRAFAEHDSVMGVTGLVVPFELETPAQALFEHHGGFGRGFRFCMYQLRSPGAPRQVFHLGAGRFGTGANMAFRRSIFASMDGFDVTLGAGTPSKGGEDLDMFFRVIEAGHALAYEPRAVVRHVHRRDHGDLRRQLEGHGIGLYAYFVRDARAYPRRSLRFTELALRWFWRHNVRRMGASLACRSIEPRDLIWAELRGSLRGPAAYREASRDALRTVTSVPAQGSKSPSEVGA
jgi:GT2 family glycosyltransferase